MKNKILYLFLGIILIILLVFGTYAWYSYFLKFNKNNVNNDNSKNVNTTVKVGDIEFKEENAVYDDDAKSIDDIEVSKVPEYKFKIINNGNGERGYTVLIEDIPVNLVDDGCSDDNILSRNDLKYQLYLNGKKIKEDYLSSIKDNILDTRTLKTKETNDYILKVYIHENAKDWVGKHYHYKVVLKK